MSFVYIMPFKRKFRVYNFAKSIKIREIRENMYTRKLVHLRYSPADWDGHCDHLRAVSRGDMFRLGASAAAIEFCESVEYGIYAYIHTRKYQVKSHTSPRFSATCTSAIAHREHFFCL